MIISGKQVESILRIYGKQGAQGVKAKPAALGAGKCDEVTISADSAIRQRAVQAAKETPDVREEKVSDIREALAAGTYKVSEREVAEKMIFRALIDRLV